MTRDKRVEKAQLKVLFNCPFFASGVARLPVQFDASVETACTNGKVIKWNPKWFDKLSDDELVTVYCEEVAHCMLGHVWRMPTGGDVETWNQAADYCARNMMEDFKELKRSQGHADPFPFPENVAKMNHRQYNQMYEEQIYQMLLIQKPPGGGKGPGKGGGGGGGKGQGQGKQPPFGQIDPQSTNNQTPQSQDAKSSQRDWQNTFISAVHAAKQRGEVPAGIQRMIDELLNPEVPWQELLRNLLREMAQDDWNWMKPDIMLSDSTGFILPSLESERIGAVVFGIDTSGSIDHELLKAFKGEEQGCLDTMKPSKLTEICCDAEIHRVKEYRAGDTVDGEAPGGGGTRLEKIFKHLDKQQEQPKCVVILTDLQTSFPDTPPEYPVIWVVYGTDDNAPFGTTIRVK